MTAIKVIHNAFQGKGVAELHHVGLVTGPITFATSENNPLGRDNMKEIQLGCPYTM